MANRFTYYESPLGTVTLQANDEGLLGLWFEIYTTKPEELGVRDDSFPIFELVADQLNRYFAGEVIQFSVPIAAKGDAISTVGLAGADDHPLWRDLELCTTG